MAMLIGAAGFGTAQAQSPKSQGKSATANEALTQVNYVQPPSAPTYAPATENNAQPVVFDAASLPKCKVDYMRSHPEEFTFRQDGKVEMKASGAAAITDAVAKNESPEVYDVASLSNSKLEYMRSHPEEFTFRTDGKVEAIASQPAEPTYTVVVDKNAAPVVFDIASLPKSKLDYMRAHPAEFKFRDDGKVEMKALTVPNPGSGKIDVDAKRWDAASPEKRSYILAHPEQYNLVRGSTDK